MTKTNNPKVSIIIPTYNSSKYICESIKSAVSQTYDNIEIIVIDDGSTDNTRIIISDFIKNGKIKYFYQENKGWIFSKILILYSKKGAIWQTRK